MLEEEDIITHALNTQTQKLWQLCYMGQFLVTHRKTRTCWNFSFLAPIVGCSASYTQYSSKHFSYHTYTTILPYTCTNMQQMRSSPTTCVCAQQGGWGWYWQTSAYNTVSPSLQPASPAHHIDGLLQAASSSPMASPQPKNIDHTVSVNLKLKTEPK